MRQSVVSDPLTKVNYSNKSSLVNPEGSLLD